MKKNWQQVTLSDYQKMNEIITDEFDSDEIKHIRIVALLCGVDEDEIWNLTPYEVNLLRAQILFIKTPPEPGEKMVKNLVLGGKKYHINYNVNKMTYAQFVDFSTFYQKHSEKEAEGTYIPSVLATLLIPDGKETYNKGYDIEEVINDVRENLTVQMAVDIIYFFLKTSQTLSEISRDCSLILMRLKMMITRNPETRMRMKATIAMLKAQKTLQSFGFIG